MKITTVVAFHVRPGKTAQLIEAIKGVTKTLERAGGASIKVQRQVFGPQPGNIIVVAEYSDWNAFAKASSDAEFQQAVERFNTNPDPPAELVVTAVLEEMSL